MMRRKKQNTSSNNLPTKISAYRNLVDTALHEELCQRRESPFFGPFIGAFAGGKRLRPILLLLAYDSVGGHDGDPLPAAVAVELAHMESLIHDDIIDGDGVRRNSLAFHKVHGQEMALLSADFILSMILSISARYEDPRITSALARATACMCEGELRERLVVGKIFHPREYQEIVAKKTGALFEAAATIGALIGKGTPREVRSLAAFARAYGIAFQIQDDITDGAQGQTISLDLGDTDYSQDEYLRESAAESVREALARLRPLKSSEAKRDLTQLARLIITPSAQDW